VYEDLARSLGVRNVHVIDPSADAKGFAALLKDSLAGDELTVIVARRPCLLIAGKVKEYERAGIRQTCDNDCKKDVV
jgi:indolepyruvate ferredoxin oxidoreductase alpha subunit